jgi:DNA excision repair protein ERCC-4
LEDSLPPDDAEFEPVYGLLIPAQTVIVRAYTDDSDDRMLAELQPRFIVMYEPNQDFIRRIEVCIMNNLMKGYLTWMCRYTRHQILALGSAPIS